MRIQLNAGLAVRPKQAKTIAIQRRTDNLTERYCNGFINPRSNKRGRKRPYTEKYDDLHVIVLRSYISVSYTEIYGDIRTKIRSFTVSVNGDRIRSPFCSVFFRIRTNTTVYGYGDIRP